MSDERREKRREIRYLQSESVWLQKALFALRKAEDARDKVAEVRDEKAAPYTLEVNGRDVLVSEIEDALEVRVEGMVRNVREMRRKLH